MRDLSNIHVKYLVFSVILSGMRERQPNQMRIRDVVFTNLPGAIQERLSPRLLGQIYEAEGNLFEWVDFLERTYEIDNGFEPVIERGKRDKRKYVSFSVGVNEDGNYQISQKLTTPVAQTSFYPVASLSREYTSSVVLVRGAINNSLLHTSYRSQSQLISRAGDGYAVCETKKLRPPRGLKRLEILRQLSARMMSYWDKLNIRSGI